VADAIAVIVKALAGGSLVVLFSLLSESLLPKRFAGLFGAAPSVAIAGLAVTLVSKGVVDARDDSLGMIAGSVGMVAYACAAVLLLKRTPSLVASVAGSGVWLVVAVAVAVPLI
jgi:uncharacterized membrane protein (GlpM family)